MATHHLPPVTANTRFAHLHLKPPVALSQLHHRKTILPPRTSTPSKGVHQGASPATTSVPLMTTHVFPTHRFHGFPVGSFQTGAPRGVVVVGGAGVGGMVGAGGSVGHGRMVVVVIGGGVQGGGVGAIVGGSVGGCPPPELLQLLSPGLEMSVVLDGVLPGLQVQSGSPSSMPFDCPSPSESERHRELVHW